MTITIIGQGLAGTLLGGELERRGMAFRVIDAGHAASASRVGAGMVTPLTGRRWVPTWRIDTWRDEAAACYDGIEATLGIMVRRDMRVWRRFRDADDRTMLESKRARPDVRDWLGPVEAEGAWIHGAWQVETGAIIAGFRERWLGQGRLRETTADPTASGEHTADGPVIWCTGAGLVPLTDRGDGYWQYAGGEIVEGRLEGSAIAPDVILNDGRWLVPLGEGRVRVGSTYRRDEAAVEPTAAGRGELVEVAARLAGGVLRVDRHEAAVRVNTLAKRPVAGWWPGRPGEGVFGGLASKGTLWAPALARQWADQLEHGTAFDPEVDAARLAGGGGDAA